MFRFCSQAREILACLFSASFLRLFRRGRPSCCCCYVCASTGVGVYLRCFNYMRTSPTKSAVLEYPCSASPTRNGNDIVHILRSMFLRRFHTLVKQYIHVTCHTFEWQEERGWKVYLSVTNSSLRASQRILHSIIHGHTDGLPKLRSNHLEYVISPNTTNTTPPAENSLYLPEQATNQCTPTRFGHQPYFIQPQGTLPPSAGGSMRRPSLVLVNYIIVHTA